VNTSNYSIIVSAAGKVAYSNSMLPFLLHDTSRLIPAEFEMALSCFFAACSMMQSERAWNERQVAFNLFFFYLVVRSSTALYELGWTFAGKWDIRREMGHLLSTGKGDRG
jgi:hypothetical protein